MESFLGLPLDVSKHGHEIDALIAYVHWLMLPLFVGWGAYFIYVLFRFRAGRNPKASYTGTKSRFSTYVEVGVAIAEAVLLIGFSIPAWAKRVNDVPPEEGEAVEIHVVAQQFAWNIHYPGADGMFGRRDPKLVNEQTNPLGLDRGDPAAQDDITTINQLHLPVDRPILIRLSTKDVIHSFALPYMRVKHDAIPGMEIPLWFVPTMVTPEESRLPKCAPSKTCWEIACAQLCGNSHYNMRGFVTVHSQEDFDAWLAKQAPKPKEPETPAPAPADGESEGEEGVEEAA